MPGFTVAAGDVDRLAVGSAAGGEAAGIQGLVARLEEVVEGGTGPPDGLDAAGAGREEVGR